MRRILVTSLLVALAAVPVAQAGPQRAGCVRPLGDSTSAYAAVVPAHATVYRAPGGRPLARFDAVNRNGAGTIFGVTGETRCGARWYRIQLPLRPNGALGWVRAREVAVGRVPTRIVVDLSARTLTLLREGRPLLRATTAVGSPSTPTPTGRFYVNQRLIPADEGGPFGPGAIGVSAFSPVLTGWAQGGPIAIHGTNQPWSIGRAVSNGCIRVRNDVLRRLFAATPAGTPVIIRS